MNIARLKYHFDRVNCKPSIVLDIGAHTCQWTLQFKQHFDCFVHMFEANDELMLASIGKLDKTIYTVALLGDEYRENVIFYKVKAGNSTGNSIYRENSVYFHDCNITYKTMQRLDDILEDRYSKIDLIKLDVQGAELSILRGASATISKCDLILLEVSFQAYNQGAPLAAEVFNFMDEIGFQAIDILEQHYFARDFIQADFLFARKESPYIIKSFG